MKNKKFVEWYNKNELYVPRIMRDDYNVKYENALGIDDPDHEDRRKEWLENYAAEEAGYVEPNDLF